MFLVIGKCCATKMPQLFKQIWEKSQKGGELLRVLRVTFMGCRVIRVSDEEMARFIDTTTAYSQNKVHYLYVKSETGASCRLYVVR